MPHRINVIVKVGLDLGSSVIYEYFGLDMLTCVALNRIVARFRKLWRLYESMSRFARNVVCEMIMRSNSIWNEHV